MTDYINIPEYGAQSWREPVPTAYDLPTNGNNLGDTRVAMDTGVIYVWNGSIWVADSNSSGTLTNILTTTPALVITNSTGPVVTMNILTATALQAGILSASDWNTFNSKQPALGFTPENVANKSTDTSLGGGSPSNILYPTQEAVKNYVDSLTLGLLWQQPIADPCLADDSLSAPPAGMHYSIVYIIAGTPTGAWSSFAQGHAVSYFGGAWHDLLGRPVHTGDRFLITAADGAGQEGGSFVGKHDYFATVSGGGPGAYTYTFVAPAINDATFVSVSVNTEHAGEAYTYASGLNRWVQFSAGNTVQTGTALSYFGTTLNVLVDGTTVTTNVSNQLTLAPSGVTNSILAPMAAHTVKGNNTAASATPSDLALSSVVESTSSVLTITNGTNAIVSPSDLTIQVKKSGISQAGYLSAADFNALGNIPRPATFALWNATPQPVGTVKFQSVTIQGNYAYVAGGSTTATLSIYNISNQSAPVLQGTLGLAGTYQIAVQGNYAYVPSSGSSRLYVVDISNPANPTITGNVVVSGSAGSLYTCVVSGNYCYISTQNKGLTVVDVTNPALPIQVYQEGGTTNKSFGVAKAGNTLYTTNYQTSAPWTVRYLKTWDVSTPSAPVLQNTYTLPAGTKPNNLSVYGNTVYVTDGNTNTVQMIDVTTPTSPSYITSMPVSGVFPVDALAIAAAVADNFVYIPSGGNGTWGGAIDMYDISVRTAPIKIATAYNNNPTSPFGGIAISNGYIFAADYGVAPGAAGALDVFPLPFEQLAAGNIIGSTISAARWINIRSGPLLATPVDGTLEYSGGILYKTIGSTRQDIATPPAALATTIEFELNNPSNYKNLVYSGSTLTDVNIYTDNTMTTLLFSKHLTYTSGQLTGILITRALDGHTLQKTLVYSGTNLIHVTATYT